jgi:hypothetical protein
VRCRPWPPCTPSTATGCASSGSTHVPSAQSFAEERGVRYENYLDPNGEFLAAAGIGTFPSTLLVSTDGTIVRLRAGEVDQTTLASLIEEDLLS